MRINVAFTILLSYQTAGISKVLFTKCTCSFFFYFKTNSFYIKKKVAKTILSLEADFPYFNIIRVPVGKTISALICLNEDVQFCFQQNQTIYTLLYGLPSTITVCHTKLLKIM